MFQIIFNPISASEMAKMPKELQLEILSEFQFLPHNFAPGREGEKFGTLQREGSTYYRFRAKDYRIYFQKNEQGVVVHRVLHKNTIKDFLFRSKLPMGEDEELQKNPKFWKLLDEAIKQ